MSASARIQDIEETSTVTEKGQTTVPKSVRQALGIAAGDRIAFRVNESGVTVRRVDDAHTDPALGAFLAFLAQDIAANPAKLQALTPQLQTQIEDLIDGISVDTDAPLDGDIEL